MTWSIIFHEKDSGRIAIAVATKFFAVGARVPYIAPQKGAVATQALVNPLYGIDGLQLIRDGVGAQDVVRILTSRDEGQAHRQVHVLGADGRFAAHTGAACVSWSFMATETASGRNSTNVSGSVRMAASNGRVSSRPHEVFAT